MELIILKQFVVSALLASLIGLEREKHSLNEDRGILGVRTFILIGLFGAMSNWVLAYSQIGFAVLTFGFFALLTASYLLTYKEHNSTGATTEFAAILVYLIGIMCGQGEYFLATVLTLLILTTLYFKSTIHTLARVISPEEIKSTIQFLLIAFVVLPILPNESYGPFGFFNPYIVWLMVVFISGLSFLSYVSIRLLGSRKGIVLAGFLAGFISSTALTLTYSERSKRDKKTVYPYVIAIVVASTAMFVRVLLTIFVLNPTLFYKALIVVLPMIAVGILSVLYFWWRSSTAEKSSNNSVSDIKSPFNLLPAIKFALFFVFILFLTSYLNYNFGDKGVYIGSVVSAIADVDAITVSIAELAGKSLNFDVALLAITLATITNTLVKGVIFLTLGSRKVALRISAVFVLMTTVSILSWLSV